MPCLFSLLVTVKLKPEIISQGDRELIVNMTILQKKTKLERLIYDAPDNQTHSIIGFKSLPKRLIKTQEQRNMHLIILLANTA